MSITVIILQKMSIEQLKASTYPPLSLCIIYIAPTSCNNYKFIVMKVIISVPQRLELQLSSSEK